MALQAAETPAHHDVLYKFDPEHIHAIPVVDSLEVEDGEFSNATPLSSAVRTSKRRRSTSVFSETASDADSVASAVPIISKTKTRASRARN